VSQEQIAAWRRAIAARAKAARRQRGRHRKTDPAIKPGMIRRNPPPKETP